ncbi:hypothetical protein [Granulicella mallensis]|uniref:Uncharacterized protein n=1 Tax=Granulicella mallensis TaxID=940614 RepID=A0A7W8E8X6_9BACT|nr:hypothetical protein [Granulicella mallensis]MBB5063903.1 hypothetical protein [Granulicella mallensis]
MKSNESSFVATEARPIEALIAIALQLRARLDAKDGLKRNLGSEAVLLRAFGFRNPDIALIIGSTPGSVAELISQAQKTKGAKNGKAKNGGSKDK